MPDMSTALEELLASIAAQYGGASRQMPGIPGMPGQSGMSGMPPQPEMPPGQPGMPPSQPGMPGMPPQPSSVPPQSVSPQPGMPSLPQGEPLPGGLQKEKLGQLHPAYLKSMDLPMQTGSPDMTDRQRATVRNERGYGLVQGGYDPEARSAVMRGLEGPGSPSNAPQSDASGMPPIPRPPMPASKKEAFNELRRYYPTLSALQLRAKLPEHLKTMDASRKQQYDMSLDEYKANSQHVRDLMALDRQGQTSELLQAKIERLQQQIDKGNTDKTVPEYMSTLKRMQELRLGAEAARGNITAAQEELDLARDAYSQSLPAFANLRGKKGGSEEEQTMKEAEARLNAAKEHRKSLSDMLGLEERTFMEQRQQQSPSTAAPRSTSAQPATQTTPGQDTQPPMEGARRAPDGQWYVQKEGKWFRVTQ